MNISKVEHFVMLVVTAFILCFFVISTFFRLTFDLSGILSGPTDVLLTIIITISIATISNYRSENVMRIEDIGQALLIVFFAVCTLDLFGKAFLSSTLEGMLAGISLASGVATLFLLAIFLN